MRLLPALLALALSLPATTAYAADELETCNRALVRGQELRQKGLLVAARAEFPTCLRASCAAELRAVCANFVAELTRAIPSLRLESRASGGASIDGASFFVDGRLVDAASLVEVDPGEHRVRVEAKGFRTAERTVLAKEGGPVAVELTLAPLPPSEEGPSSPSPTFARERAPVPAATYALGGIAVVALGSFGYFALNGKGTEQDLRAQCPLGPCDSAPMRRDYLIADVSAIVAVVAAGTAALLALNRGHVTR